MASEVIRTHSTSLMSSYICPQVCLHRAYQLLKAEQINWAETTPMNFISFQAPIALYVGYSLTCEYMLWEQERKGERRLFIWYIYVHWAEGGMQWLSFSSPLYPYNSPARQVRPRVCALLKTTQLVSWLSGDLNSGPYSKGCVWIGIGIERENCGVVVPAAARPSSL